MIPDALFEGFITKIAPSSFPLMFFCSFLIILLQKLASTGKLHRIMHASKLIVLIIGELKLQGQSVVYCQYKKKNYIPAKSITWTTNVIFKFVWVLATQHVELMRSQKFFFQFFILDEFFFYIKKKRMLAMEKKTTLYRPQFCSSYPNIKV